MASVPAQNKAYTSSPSDWAGKADIQIPYSILSPSPGLRALLGIFGCSGLPHALALLFLGLFPGVWGWGPTETYCLSPDGAR